MEMGTKMGARAALCRMWQPCGSRCNRLTPALLTAHLLVLHPPLSGKPLKSSRPSSRRRRHSFHSRMTRDLRHFALADASIFIDVFVHGERVKIHVRGATRVVHFVG